MKKKLILQSIGNNPAICYKAQIEKSEQYDKMIHRYAKTCFILQCFPGIIEVADDSNQILALAF
jgi:hypothetical protein